MNSIKLFNWLIGLTLFVILSCAKQKETFNREKVQHLHYLDQFEAEFNVKKTSDKVHKIVQWERMRSGEKWGTISNSGFIFNRKQQLIFSSDENEKSVYYYTKLLKPLTSITFNKTREILYKKQFLYSIDGKLIALLNEGNHASSTNNLYLFSYRKQQLKTTFLGEHFYQITTSLNNNKTEIIYTISDNGDTLNCFKHFYTDNNLLIREIRNPNSNNCAGRNDWFYTYDRYGNCITEKTHNLLITHQFQYDQLGNWIKKTSYYNNETIPSKIICRKITYYR